MKQGGLKRRSEWKPPKGGPGPTPRSQESSGRHHKGVKHDRTLQEKGGKAWTGQTSATACQGLPGVTKVQNSPEATREGKRSKGQAE